MPSQIKERPIIFSADMVKANSVGHKSQSRRVIKPQPWMEMDREIINQGGPGEEQYGPEYIPVWPQGHKRSGEIVARHHCPYGQPGSVLWGRETFMWDEYDNVYYRADYPEVELKKPECEWRWKPSIHMPRQASRITLEVVDVRVERLQDISWQDCTAEGINRPGWMYRLESEPKQQEYIIKQFNDSWDSINAKRGYGWDTNCWVWVIEFKVMK